MEEGQPGGQPVSREQIWLNIVWLLVLLAIGYAALDLMYQSRQPRRRARRKGQRMRQRPADGAAGPPDRSRDQGDGAAGGHVDDTPF